MCTGFQEERLAVRSIITYENPRLRKKSVKIKRIDAELQGLIDDLIDTMRAAEGIGLAAPQVGVLLRVIVAEYTDEEDELQQTVLINPEITTRAGEWMAEEGCLSIPGYLGTVPRAESVTVKGKNRAGKDVRIKTDGTLAHILQHEIDHLDGVLYIDYLDSPDDLVKTEPPSRRRRRRRGADNESPDLADDEMAPAPAGATEADDLTSAPSDLVAPDPALSAAPEEGRPSPQPSPRGRGSEAANSEPITGGVVNEARGSGASRGGLSIRIDPSGCCDICGHL